MGTRFEKMAASHQDFINRQAVYFVGTATADSTINVSPKGADSFRIVDANRVAWLNLTGSANESAAHVQHNPRMTIMFCAFDGSAMILRLFGTARAVHMNDPDWKALYGLFEPNISARQIFDMQVEIVQSSCGFGVPLMEYQQDREDMSKWAEKKGPQGIVDYWHDNNQVSLDGIESHILAKNLPKT